MKPLSILITTIVYFSSLSIPALAGQIWQGKGEIVRGAGGGGLLDLKIEVEGNNVKFLTGPSQNQQFTLSGNSLNGSAEIASLRWHFEQNPQQLNVTLYQEKPYRVILYRLSQSN